MATAREVYLETVRRLPPAERLRLAALILQELADLPSKADPRESWDDEDLKDLAEYSLGHAATAYPEEADLV